MGSRLLHTYSFSERASWHLDDGREVFVKLNSSNNREKATRQRYFIKRERSCLRLLRGLAVPELVSLDRALVSRGAGGGTCLYVAQSIVARKHINELGLTPPQIVGAWLFVVEQLAAFRRHGVVFTDLKPENFMGAKRPLRIFVIDFGCAGAVCPGGRRLDNYGYTRGSEAPEITQGQPPTERSVVFEVGGLLFHLLTGLNNFYLVKEEATARAYGQLEDMGATGIAEVLKTCLAREPKLRPKNYEALLKSLKKQALPRDVDRVWTALRAPYVDRLLGLGITR